MYLLAHENITISSESQILVNDLHMRPLWNMLYKAWSSVLSTESTRFVTNFTSFLKLLKEFRFLKGASIIYLNFSPYYRSVPKYIGKAIITCTFYAVSQYKIQLLTLISKITFSCQPFWKKHITIKQIVLWQILSATHIVQFKKHAIWIY